MGFSEAIRLEAKRRAHFQCVVCKTPYFCEVHHLVPQSEGGDDSLENAAPLCPSCHDWFGGNPDKRKAIRQVRDFHWEQCERALAGQSMAATCERLDRLQEEFASQRQDQLRMGQILNEIKATLVEALTVQVKSIDAARSVDEVVQASASAHVHRFGVLWIDVGVEVPRDIADWPEDQVRTYIRNVLRPEARERAARDYENVSVRDPMRAIRIRTEEKLFEVANRFGFTTALKRFLETEAQSGA